MEQLKPCPFCGGEAVLYVSKEGVCVVCFKCRVKTKSRIDCLEFSKPTNATQRAIDDWNRRADHG